jgi:uncharacterized membrane protein HdeD (DUF308 family)
MSTHRDIDNPLVAGIEEVRSSWGWFLFLGILLMITGTFCIVANVTATFATVLVFGWLLMISGVFALVHAFQVRNWGGFFLYFLSALLRGFTGYLLIRYPAAGALSFTLILASFFVVTGIFRAVGAAMLQFPRWGWATFSGIVSLVLGIMLLVQMPVSSIWFIGFALGLDMIFDGAALIGVATAIHSIPSLTTGHAKAA